MPDERTQRDVGECSALAHERVGRNGMNAAQAGRKAGAAATKLLLEWNEGDKVYQGDVENGLERRGHDVPGWR